MTGHFTSYKNRLNHELATVPANQARFDRPYRIQSLIGRSHWETDRLHDVARRYVIEAIGDTDYVLVVDETVLVKKGQHSVGAACRKIRHSGSHPRVARSASSWSMRAGSVRRSSTGGLYLLKDWSADTAARATTQLPDGAGLRSRSPLWLKGRGLMV
jgi:SRSO17 transposase